MNTRSEIHTRSIRRFNRLAVALIGIAVSVPAACWAQPSIKPGGVISAYAFGGFTSIAPGSWIEIYGSNLATNSRSWAATDFIGASAPTALDGTTVTIGGQKAFIDYISAGQVNVQVPSNVGTGSQPLIVTTTAAGASASYPVTVNAEEPGLLAPPSFDIGGRQYVVALFSDEATYVLPPATIAGLASRRAKPGDVITLYGVGFGPVAPSISAGQIVQQANALSAPFHLFFGQTEATITYAGLAPSAVGLYQFNANVPNVTSSDAIAVTFTLAGGSGKQTLYIPVQNGPLTTQVQTLTLSTSSVGGGGSVQCTVLLNTAAPSSGAVVSLSSSNSAAGSVPASVTVPAGATSATFTITTSAMSATQTATVTATYGGASSQATLTVTPPSPPPFLSMTSPLTFRPVGYASGAVALSLTLNADNSTFTTVVAAYTTLNGSFTNQGTVFTANVLQANALYPPYGIFGVGDNNLYLVSSASLSFTLTPNPTFANLVGDLAGTLTVTGTPWPSGGASVTLSGAISGKYVAQSQ
jgi:uncharacterized protein (TIGR03437 family)